MDSFSPDVSSNTDETTWTETSDPARRESGPAPLAHALAMARRGYRVFPCHGINPDVTCTCRRGRDCTNPGKHPCVKGWQKLATADPVRIAKLWRDWPRANPGIALDSDQVCVDIDGLAGLAFYLGHAGLVSIPADTLVVRSGSSKPGKVHVYHSLPAGVRVKNGKHSKGGVSPLVEIDIKTRGGFVVGPDGIHKCGLPYVALSWGGAGSTPIPPSLLALLDRKAASSPLSGPSAPKTAPKPAEARKPLPSQREGIVGRANPAQVHRLLGRMIARFPITAQGQRDDQVFRMIGHLLGTGHRAADVRAVGRDYLAHFHELGLIATPIQDCYTGLDERISRMLTRADAGEFTISTERGHLDRARARGLSCWLDSIPDRILSSARSPNPPAPGTEEQRERNVIGEQETNGDTPSPETDPSRPLVSPTQPPGPRQTKAEAGERYRGTRAGRAPSVQERAFFRSVLSWVAYKLSEFPEEGEILLTDGQIRGLMGRWGHPVEEEGPTIRRLKAKFFTQEEAATVYPFLVRTSRGRVVRGKGEPSRYLLSPGLAAAILALPEPGEPTPDWTDDGL